MGVWWQLVQQSVPRPALMLEHPPPWHQQVPRPASDRQTAPGQRAHGQAALQGRPAVAKDPGHERERQMAQHHEDVEGRRGGQRRQRRQLRQGPESGCRIRPQNPGVNQA